MRREQRDTIAAGQRMLGGTFDGVESGYGVGQVMVWDRQCCGAEHGVGHMLVSDRGWCGEHHEVA